MEKCDFCGNKVNECEAHHFEDGCECDWCIDHTNAIVLKGKQFCSAECESHFINDKLTIPSRSIPITNHQH